MIFASYIKQEGLEILSELHIIMFLLEIFKEILFMNSKFHDGSGLNKKAGEEMGGSPCSQVAVGSDRLLTCFWELRLWFATWLIPEGQG